jgi:hypothetical protein
LAGEGDAGDVLAGLVDCVALVDSKHRGPAYRNRDARSALNVRRRLTY